MNSPANQQNPPYGQNPPQPPMAGPPRPHMAEPPQPPSRSQNPMPQGVQSPAQPVGPPYPVVNQFTVPPKSGWLQSRKQQLSKIPRNRVDVGLVVNLEGDYALIPNGMALHEFDYIRQVNQILFVDLREKFIDIEINLPTYAGHEDRKITVRYSCRVIDPVSVLQAGLSDIWSKLGSWTRTSLKTQALRIALEDYENFDGLATDEIQVLLLSQPPVAPTAMHIELADIGVELPQSLKDHLRQQDQAKRERELWLEQQKLEAQRYEAEEQRRREQADLNLRAANHSTKAVLSLAAANDPDRLLELAEAVREEDRELKETIREQMRKDPVFESRAKKKLLDRVGNNTNVDADKGSDLFGSRKDDPGPSIERGDQLIDVDEVEEQDAVSSIFDSDDDVDNHSETQTDRVNDA